MSADENLSEGEAQEPRVLALFRVPPKYLLKVSPTYYKPIERRYEKKFKTTSEQYEISSVPITSISVQDAHAQDPPEDLSQLASGRCLICIDGKSDAVLMDCGHSGLCYNCSINLRDSKGVCHICRSPISGVFEIRRQTSNVVEIKN